MSPIVKLNQGILKGKENKSILSEKVFYTFQGIPYAKPPIKELRFQAPKPYGKWEGVYDATYERNICTQQDLLLSNSFQGNEDCLYINVTTPQKPEEIQTLKPVMVFIHGGLFNFGSGSKKFQSGDFLMERDVILVTFNYRLHILGFLNLGIPECPGNVGLKDQTLALKWIKENIAKFGGDSDNITIFGESAGASSVHFHILSPLSKGLFNKAICQSGSAFSPWAMTYNPYEIALKAGNHLGYTGDSREELLKFLRQQTDTDLLSTVAALRKENRSAYPYRCASVPFSPSVEEITINDAFLPDLPENLLRIASPLPIIFGANDNEGMLCWNFLTDIRLEQIKDDISVVLEQNFKIDKALLPTLAKQVKQYYFEDRPIGTETKDQLTNLFNDLYFYFFYDSIEFVTASSFPVFIYEFGYDGGLNQFKNRMSNQSKEETQGAVHADELGYLFHWKLLNEIPSFKKEDLKMIENITSLWTNFAKFGSTNEQYCTFTTKQKLHTVVAYPRSSLAIKTFNLGTGERIVYKRWFPTTDSTWKPSTPENPYYLRIEHDLKMVKGKVFGERLQNLKNLLDPIKQFYNIF